MTGTAFGCGICWPDAAEGAGQARGELCREATLVDEAHLIASVLACPRCSQRFVSVFVETIDWAGGADSQVRIQYPLTVHEAERLTGGGAKLTEADLSGLDRERRSLVLGVLKDGVEKCVWTKGLAIGWHD